MPARHICLRVLLASLLVALVCSQPFQGQQPNLPKPAPQPQPGSGHVGGSVSRIPGAGLGVHVEGQQDVWKSRDGNTRFGVSGSYDRIVHGPARGAHRGEAWARFEHRF